MKRFERNRYPMTTRTDDQTTNLEYRMSGSNLRNDFSDTTRSRYSDSGISSSIMRPINKARYCVIFTVTSTFMGMLKGLFLVSTSARL